MRKWWIFLYALVLLLMAGCGSQTGLHPNLSHPAKDLTTTPYVEFLGDDQIQGVVSNANNPMWKCTTCAPGQTSDQVLAEVPAVIALHPAIVIILTGAYDQIDNPDITHNEDTLPNIGLMLDAFAAAKIPAVVCELPPSDSYDDYYVDDGIYVGNQEGIFPFILNYDPNVDGAMTDGVDFNTYGLSLVEPLTYQEIETLGLGGQK
jgi:hypothetical protein